MRIRLCTLLLLAAFAAPATAEDLLLKNVNVVDVDSGAIVAGRSVVVSDGHIKEIGAQESVRAPAGARVIDGNGRYLMPALWDMHTHPMEPKALSMLVANGVGGTRIMWGLPRHLEWRARVELGELLGPRLLIAGPIIEGVPPSRAASVVDTEGRRLVKTFAEGVAEVRRQQAAGFDYIKVYNNIPLDAYNGLVAEAARLRMPVVGHVPFAAGIQGALAARQKSIEHLRGYIEKLVPRGFPEPRTRQVAEQFHRSRLRASDARQRQAGSATPRHACGGRTATRGH